MPALTLIPQPPLPHHAAASPDAAHPNMAVEIKPRRWFLTLKPALETAQQLGGMCFLVARDINDTSGAKQFAALDAPPRGALLDASCYEVITVSRKRHVGLDIEWSKSENPELELEPTLASIFASVEDLHGTGILERQMLSASRDDKISIHAVFTTTCLTFDGMKAFANMLEERIAPRNFPKGVPDFGVYSKTRAMRMLSQTKKGKDRPLVPYGTSSADCFDHLWCIYEDATPITWEDPRAVVPRPETPPRIAFLPEPSTEVRADVNDLMDMFTTLGDATVMRKRYEYSNWLTVGMALKNIGASIKAPDAFFNDWEEWSSNGPSYKAGACAEKWGTFTPREKPGMGSLRYWAKEANPVLYADFVQRWFDARDAAKQDAAEAQAEFDAQEEARVDAPAELPPAPVMEVPAMRVSTFAVPTGLPGDTYENVKVEFEKTRAVVNNPFHFMRLNVDSTIQRMAKATIVDMHQNVRLFKAPGAKESQNFMKTWLSDPTRRTVEKVDFYPPPLVVPENCYNTFTGFNAAKYASVPDVDLKPILHQIDVITGHAPGGTEYMLNWLAALVQRPGADKHMATAILFKGEPGTGKTSFIDWIGNKVIGVDHYRYINDAENGLFARFSNALEQSILVCIDEAHQLHKHADKFKSYITQSTTRVEVKGIQPVEVNNSARFLLATNNDNALKAEGNDRRFVAFKVSSEHKDDVEYYTGLNKWMEEPANVRAFFDMLMARDIAGVHLQASRPKTEEYRKMQLLNVPAVVEFLVEQYEKRPSDAVDVGGKKFRERFMEWARENNRAIVLGFSSTYTTQLFSNYGIKAIQTRMEGKIERGYRVDWVAARKAIEEAFAGVPLFDKGEVVEGDASEGEEDVA